MNKFVKVGLVFAGGFVVGGMTITKAALRSQHFQKALVDALADKFTKVLFGEEQTRAACRKSPAFSSKDILIESRREADMILDQMEAVINTYGMVSVADLYDLCGLTSPHYKDTKYGWTDISNAKVVRVREGYILDLPNPMRTT